MYKRQVWGRPTVGQHEQEAVLTMLEAQRKEREEYTKLVNEGRWQQDCERKMRAYELSSSARRAEERASARRASEAPAPDPATTKRVASIVHRIHRRTGDEPLTTSEAQALINRGLKRLGKEALVLGGFALISAVAYLTRLQEDGAPSLLERVGILEAPGLAASATDGIDPVYIPDVHKRGVL